MFNELRTLIDAGDKDYAQGRYTTYEKPGDLAADIIARARLRAEARTKTS